MRSVRLRGAIEIRISWCCELGAVDNRQELEFYLEGIELLRTHVGAEWVDREEAAVFAHLQTDTSGGRGPRARFHPAAEHFGRVKDHIARSGSEIKVIPELVRLGVLGQQIAVLANAELAGLTDRVRRLRSDDWDSFASAAFELEVAALHVQIRRQVRFVDEVSTPTPDLLVDGIFEVECKSVRQLTQRDENNREMWSQLKRKLWAQTAGAKGFYVEFETKHDVRQDDIKWVLENIKATNLEDRVIEGAGRRLRVAGLDPKVEGAGIACSPPAGSPPLEEFDVGEVELMMQVQGNVPTGNQSAYIFAFRTAEKPDWYKRAYRALRHARNQFSKTLPALIFVEFPALHPQRHIKVAVKGAVTEFFRQSTTASAVVACFTRHEQIEAGVGVRRSYEYERHSRARLPAPPVQQYFGVRSAT